jgi:D-arabinose 5-phosphate isomerase GutQ
LAKGAGARIALLTAHPENEHGQLADLCVRIPGQIFGGSQEVKCTNSDHLCFANPYIAANLPTTNTW